MQIQARYLKVLLPTPLLYRDWSYRLLALLSAIYMSSTGWRQPLHAEISRVGPLVGQYWQLKSWKACLRPLAGRILLPNKGKRAITDMYFRCTSGFVANATSNLLDMPVWQ